MTAISFTSASNAQQVINNVESIAQAILQAYEPVSSRKSNSYIYISHVPNELCGCIIKLSQNNTKASITIPINDTSSFFGEKRYPITNGLSEARRKQDGFSEYVKKTILKPAANHIGIDEFEIHGLSSYSNTLSLEIDITYLDEKKLNAINIALRTSGLRPRSTVTRNDFSFQ